MDQNNANWLHEKNLRLQELVADLLMKNQNLRHQLELLTEIVAEPRLQLKCLDRATLAASARPAD